MYLVKDVKEGSSSRKKGEEFNTLVNSERADVASKAEPHITESIIKVMWKLIYSRKRRRKPNFSTNPEEGYDSYWLLRQSKSQIVLSSRKKKKEKLKMSLIV